MSNIPNPEFADDIVKLLFGFNSNQKVTSFYGERLHPLSGEMNFHHGIDFNALNAQEIYAPFNVKVVENAFSEIYGNYLIISIENIFNEKGDVLMFMFAHLYERPNLNIGDLVMKNILLAKAGSTGLSTAARLHLETRFVEDNFFNANSINPLLVFQKLVKIDI